MIISLGSTNALLPSNRYQHSRHVLHTTLRRKKIKLRRRIPRIQHLQTDTQRRNVFLELRAERHIALSRTDDE